MVVGGAGSGVVSGGTADVGGTVDDGVVFRGGLVVRAGVVDDGRALVGALPPLLVARITRP